MIIDPTDPTSLKVPDLHKCTTGCFKLLRFFCFFRVLSVSHYCWTGKELGPAAVYRKGADAVATDAGPSQLLGGGLTRTQASPWSRQAGQVVNSLHYTVMQLHTSIGEQILPAWTRYIRCVCVFSQVPIHVPFLTLYYICVTLTTPTHTHTLWKKEKLLYN
jgi:hypothetical protein